MISGIVTVSKCSFLENMSDVDYEPAIYNVGTLSAMDNCSFFDSSFDCHPGTYFNYHAVRNGMQIILSYVIYFIGVV